MRELADIQQVIAASRSDRRPTQPADEVLDRLEAKYRAQIPAAATRTHHGDVRRRVRRVQQLLGATANDRPDVRHARSRVSRRRLPLDPLPVTPAQRSSL